MHQPPGVEDVMNALSGLTRIALAAGSVLAFSTAGCAANKPPPPETPIYVPPSSTASVVTEPKAIAPTGPTQVHIDESILRACNIKADRAFFAFDSAKQNASVIASLCFIE